MHLRTLATLLVLLIGSGRAAHVACMEMDGSVEIESAWSGCCDTKAAPAEEAGLRGASADSCAGCADFPVRVAASMPSVRTQHEPAVAVRLPAAPWAIVPTLEAPPSGACVAENPPPAGRLAAHCSVVLLC